MSNDLLETTTQPGSTPPPVARTVGQMIESLGSTDALLTLVDEALRPTHLTGAVLARAARRAAGSLEKAGVQPGDRVFLVSSTSIEFIVSMFGVWRAGAVPVVMALPRQLDAIAAFPAEITARMAMTGSTVVIVADAFLEAAPQLESLPGTVLSCLDVADPSQPETTRPVMDDPDQLAHLQFTSGTTGAAKAVMITHRQLIEHAPAMWTGSDLSAPRLVFVGWLPWYHDMGLVTAVGVLALGGHLVSIAPETFMVRPAVWMEAVSRFGGTVTAAPNFAYTLAARELDATDEPLDLSTLEMVGNGAEPIDAAALAEFQRAAGEYGLSPNAISPMYGLAEATLGLSIDPSSRPRRYDVVSRRSLELEARAVPIDSEDDPDARILARCGPPFPGVELRIVGPDGEALEERQVGEILGTSPYIMQGYWENPEATSSTVIDGWLHTGDLGYLVDGDLVVCGRIKDMVIAGGRNLYPEDYEQVARSVEGVRPVVAAFAAVGTESMIVVAEAHPSVEDHRSVAQALLHRLVAVLSHPPAEVVMVARGVLPRTSSGKTQRHAVRTMLQDGSLPIVARVGA